MSSLIRRAALAVGAATVVVGGLAGLAVWQASATALRRTYDDALEQRLRSLGNMIRQDARGHAYLDVNPDVMPEFQRGADCAYYVILGERVDGRRSPSMPRGADLACPPVPAEPLAIALHDAALPDGRHGRIAAMRVVAAPEWDGESAPQPLPPPVTVTLITGRSREDLDGALARLARLTLLAVAAEMAVGGLVVVLVMRRLLRVLADLADDVRRLDPTRTGQRLPARAEAELAPLVACVNAAADRMADAYQRERRFASMAAHEMRTPVAELRAACELAQRWPDDRDATLRALSEGERIGKQLGDQIGMLMAITRHREGSAAMQPQTVDLAALASDACRLHLPGPRRLRLDADMPSMPVVADPTALSTLLGNLIANAAAYADADSWVRVRVAATATGAVCTVANPAVDLTPADLERFGEAYWRKDRAHSDREHAGLGLSLCLALAQASGARLDWTLGEGVVTATLRLPAA